MRGDKGTTPHDAPIVPRFVCARGVVAGHLSRDDGSAVTAFSVLAVSLSVSLVTVPATPNIGALEDI
jgi:hypothetical protein